MKFRLYEGILNEDIEAVKKRYPELDDRTFMQLIAFDPTYVEGRNSVGTYGKWILDRFKKGTVTENDFGHLRDVLTRFNEVKNTLKEKDINKFKTVQELDDYLNDDDNYKVSQRQQKRANDKAKATVDVNKDASLVYQDGKWEVWIPHTYAASCRLGSGSTWCTANTNSDYYYNHYKEEYGGEYYININKNNPDEKYQFHFPSTQFMDINDNSIDLNRFLSTNQGLKKFYLKEMFEGRIKCTFTTLSCLCSSNDELMGYLDYIDFAGSTPSEISHYIGKRFYTDPSYDKYLAKYFTYTDNVRMYFFKVRGLCDVIPARLLLSQDDANMRRIVSHIDFDALWYEGDGRYKDFVAIILGNQLETDPRFGHLFTSLPDDLLSCVREIGPVAFDYKKFKNQFSDFLKSNFEDGVIVTTVPFRNFANSPNCDFGSAFLEDCVDGENLYDIFMDNISYDFGTYEECVSNKSIKITDKIMNKLTSMGIPKDIFSNPKNADLYAGTGASVDGLKQFFVNSVQHAFSIGALKHARKLFRDSIRNCYPDWVTPNWEATVDGIGTISRGLVLEVSQDALNSDLFMTDFKNRLDQDVQVHGKFTSYQCNVEELVHEIMVDIAETNFTMETPRDEYFSYGWTSFFDEKAFENKMLYWLDGLTDWLADM